MPRVVVVGGGACGLLAAMLLAKDGHEVVLLERDPAPPPEPTEAWDTWERRGVAQFRLPHTLQSRFHWEASREFPDLTDRLRREGAWAFNDMGEGGPAQYEGLAASRPFAEACIAAEAERQPGLEIRRGIGVAGLVVGPEAVPGVPHVAGVRLEDGRELRADLVVEAGGRRSALPRWLEEIGARPPHEEVAEHGVVYYGSHFRSRTGEQAALGPVIRGFGSVNLLAVANENGTWGLGVITSKNDKEMRCLKDWDAWLRVVRALPDTEALVDAEPLHDIHVMAGITDRYRRYFSEGIPAVTGLLGVADSLVATNPSRGRGISMGFTHALGLRDVLRKVDWNDPLRMACEADAMNESVATPHFRATVWEDDHRRLMLNARLLGQPLDLSDEAWRTWLEFLISSASNPALTEYFLQVLLAYRTPWEVMADPVVQEMLEAARPVEFPAPAGPSREELLAAARG